MPRKRIHNHSTSANSTQNSCLNHSITFVTPSSVVPCWVGWKVGAMGRRLINLSKWHGFRLTSHIYTGWFPILCIRSNIGQFVSQNGRNGNSKPPVHHIKWKIGRYVCIVAVQLRLLSCRWLWWFDQQLLKSSRYSGEIWPLNKMMIEKWTQKRVR